MPSTLFSNSDSDATIDYEQTTTSKKTAPNFVPVPVQSINASPAKDMPSTSSMPDVSVSPFTQILPSPSKPSKAKSGKTKLKHKVRHLNSDDNISVSRAKKKLRFGQHKPTVSSTVTLQKIRPKTKNRKILERNRRRDGDLYYKIGLSSSSDEEDRDNIPCGFCGQKFNSAHPSVKSEWISCQKCNVWYHEICVGGIGKELFICGRCL
ncbi:MAG: PHD finger domain-containing protein [Candidatus Karelsulcia muelleri]